MHEGIDQFLASSAQVVETAEPKVNSVATVIDRWFVNVRLPADIDPQHRDSAQTLSKEAFEAAGDRDWKAAATAACGAAKEWAADGWTALSSKSLSHLGDAFLEVEVPLYAGTSYELAGLFVFDVVVPNFEEAREKFGAAMDVYISAGAIAEVTAMCDRLRRRSGLVPLELDNVPETRKEQIETAADLITEVGVALIAKGHHQLSYGPFTLAIRTREQLAELCGHSGLRNEASSSYSRATADAIVHGVLLQDAGYGQVAEQIFEQGRKIAQNSGLTLDADVLDRHIRVLNSN